MLYDEKTYPEPFTFNPERFLTKDGKLDPTVQDPSLAAFGFGRRCVSAFDLVLLDKEFTRITSIGCALEVT